MTRQVDEWTQMKFLIAQALLKDDSLTKSPTTKTASWRRPRQPARTPEAGTTEARAA